MSAANVPTRPPSTPVSDDSTTRRFGLGIDTSRYGHYAVFLRDDLQPAAAELAFAESAHGYAQLRQRLEQIAQRHPKVTFTIRLDAAGPYADNLLHFLQQLNPADSQQTPTIANAHFTISCGDPLRNKNYRAALFGSQKSDPIEARAAARFAISERPQSSPVLSNEHATLRLVAGRLQAAVRQRTRLVNQLHQLLTRTFPELALLVKDITLAWVLELVQRYPTAQLLATAAAQDLATIPYLPEQQIDPLLTHARASVAALHGPACAELLREQVRQVRDATARVKRLENLLVETYHALPVANHLDTIPGIGAVTAAVLTAVILDIDRFEQPGKLVAYFGVMPIQVSSGIDRDGRPRGPVRYVMSPRGNDLVRRYLWMAALSAVRFNPAVRALYRRVVAQHPQRKAIAIGHAMRKLLHLVFALWKTNQPFDPAHHPWEKVMPTDSVARDSQGSVAANTPAQSDMAMSANDQAAGHKPEQEPAQEVVTAACADTVPLAESIGDSTPLDFAHLKRQLPLSRVLDHLGLSARLRGSGPQRRCACPLHGGDGRGRTFSVNLADHVFHCFDKRCGQQGDVIDLWAALHRLSLREAALDLVRTFGLEPLPASATEKRHG